VTDCTHSRRNSIYLILFLPCCQCLLSLLEFQRFFYSRILWLIFFFNLFERQGNPPTLLLLRGWLKFSIHIFYVWYDSLSWILSRTLFAIIVKKWELKNVTRIQEWIFKSKDFFEVFHLHKILYEFSLLMGFFWQIFWRAVWSFLRLLYVPWYSIIKEEENAMKIIPTPLQKIKISNPSRKTKTPSAFLQIKFSKAFNP
jgi:hypothetical protein